MAQPDKLTEYHHPPDQAAHAGHESHAQADHQTMMVADFRRRFFLAFILMVPILALSPMIRMFMGVDWRFPADSYLLLGLSTILFLYGGWPFIKCAKEELTDKSPAMMTLITIIVSINGFHIRST